MRNTIKNKLHSHRIIPDIEKETIKSLLSRFMITQSDTQETCK